MMKAPLSFLFADNFSEGPSFSQGSGLYLLRKVLLNWSEPCEKERCSVMVAYQVHILEVLFDSDVRYLLQ